MGGKRPHNAVASFFNGQRHQARSGDILNIVINEPSAMVGENARSAYPADNCVDDLVSVAELEDMITGILDKFGIRLLQASIGIRWEQWFENRRKLREPGVNVIEVQELHVRHSKP